MGIFKKKEPPVHIAAVIAAAGAASRMEGIDKQMAELGEIPIVVRSIMAFQDCPAVTEIVVVCKEEQIPNLYDLVREYDLNKVATVVRGGGSRQESVFAGVGAVTAETKYLAIHDGARPLIRRIDIENCIRDAIKYRAAALGAEIRDTVKRTDSDGFIRSTLDRRNLYAIQTPQIFEIGLYRQIMEAAMEKGEEYTDDCQLAESAGYRVHVTKGSFSNLKITTPEDLDLAESLLEHLEVSGWISE